MNCSGLIKKNDVVLLQETHGYKEDACLLEHTHQSHAFFHSGTDNGIAGGVVVAVRRKGCFNMTPEVIEEGRCLAEHA